MQEKEEECKSRNHLFDEWESIHVNIRQLCNDMKNEIDEDLEHDIQSHIDALTN